MTFSDSIPQDAGFYHVIDRNDFGTPEEGNVYIVAFSPNSPYTTLMQPLEHYVNSKHRSVRDLLWGRMLFLTRFNPVYDVMTMHPVTPSEHKYMGITGRIVSDDDSATQEVEE